MTSQLDETNMSEFIEVSVDSQGCIVIPIEIQQRLEELIRRVDL